jgi:hypothetical protein
MFRSYNHLQADIYTVEISVNDNGPVVLLDIFFLVYYGDRRVPGDVQCD